MELISDFKKSKQFAYLYHGHIWKQRTQIKEFIISRECLSYTQKHSHNYNYIEVTDKLFSLIVVIFM